MVDVLLRSEEELPGDEKLAVRLADMDVLDEYRRKLDELIEKAGSIVADADVLSEIKNILSDMLSAISDMKNASLLLHESVSQSASAIENSLERLATGNAAQAEKLAYETKRLDEKLDMVQREVDKIAILTDALRSDFETFRDETRMRTGEIVALIKSVKSYKPKPKAKRKRKSRQKRKQIEDEALDLLIVNALSNVSMNIASLEQATDVSENRLRKRLNVLITRGVVVKERRGRAIFYTARTEQG